MTLKLPHIGVIPRKLNSFLGVMDYIPASNGLTLADLAKVNNYVQYQKTILRGSQGLQGEAGESGLSGVPGVNAFEQESSLLDVDTLEAYLYLFNKQYYQTLSSKYMKAFTSYWDTRRVKFGSSSSTQIKIPIVYKGVYDAVVLWGDGEKTKLTNYQELVHNYEKPGIYKIIITGDIEGLSFRYSQENEKILLITSWGGLTITENIGMFSNCTNLDIIALDKPQFKNVTSFNSYFYNCKNLKRVPNLETWSWKEVTDISYMFFNCPRLVEDLSFVNTDDYLANNFWV